MNVYELISSMFNGFITIFTAMIWPISIIIVVVMLKTPITDLIKNIAKIKYKDFELELIDKKLNEVTSNAIPNNIDVEMVDLEPLRNDFKAIREQIAIKGPRFPVVLAWRYITRRLVEICDKNDIELSYHDARDLIDVLYENNIVDLKLRDSFINLQELFGILSGYDEISESQANRFLDASEIFTMHLEIL
ncbi:MULTISPECIES: hypothetical protein [Bacillus]|uniref:hypothetical protein n=1 Tax=Bacillus TaxID=1386 RepID=UPI0037EEB442|nr:hypothetical protein [Bacillus pumilus]